MSGLTLANIRDAIEVWLPSVTKDNDRVLIYFAGHGVLAAGKGVPGTVGYRCA